MKVKNKKYSFQGMEHLKKDLVYNTDEKEADDKINKDSSIIKSELVQIIVIMFLLFSSLVAIYFINDKTSFLQNLAEKIDIWI